MVLDSRPSGVGAGGGQPRVCFRLPSICCFYLPSLFRLLVGLSPALSAAVGVEQRRTAAQEQTHTILSDSPPAVRKIPRQAEAGGDGEAPEIHLRWSLGPVSRCPAARVAHRCSSTVRQHLLLRGTSRCFLLIAREQKQRKRGKEKKKQQTFCGLVKAET